jgi:hypothetical protein
VTWHTKPRASLRLHWITATPGWAVDFVCVPVTATNDRCASCGSRQARPVVCVSVTATQQNRVVGIVPNPASRSTTPSGPKLGGTVIVAVIVTSGAVAVLVMVTFGGVGAVVVLVTVVTEMTVSSGTLVSFRRRSILVAALGLRWGEYSRLDSRHSPRTQLPKVFLLRYCEHFRQESDPEALQPDDERESSQLE